MICVDTMVLIDEFRSRGDPTAPVNRALLAHTAETLIVPVAAAGEFLDGAAMVSPAGIHGAALLTRNPAHFMGIPALEGIGYG